MKGILLLTAAIEALSRGTELLAVLDNLSAVRARMAAEDRADPTDEDMDLVRGRIVARQRRIDAV